MLEQGLAMSHEHRDQPYLVGVADNLDQLTLLVSPPIGICHVASRNLQSAVWSLEATVRVDRFLHLRKRRNRDFIRIPRQITMGAAEGAITSPSDESAMSQMSPGNLIWSLKFVRQGVPARAEQSLFLLVNRKTKSRPARPPAN